MNPTAPPAAEPLWLDTDTTPLLAWYHAPAAPVRDCGVVLCAPFGHEYLVSYRAYRQLAEGLAAAGFAVMFFDYDGCGDAGDSDAPRVARWQDNIRQAMARLQALSACQRFALFGVRLGALLAANVAAHPDHPGALPVQALAMVAPVISGRGYVRELVAFARMSPIPPSADPARQVSDEEIAGYPIAHATQADLSKLNLLKMPVPQDCAIFLSKTDDVTGREDKLVDTLRAQGHALQISEQGGYAAMMSSDAYNSQVPLGLWQELVAWLCTRSALASAPPPPTRPDRVVHRQWSDASGVAVDETLVCFDGLSGVWNRPTGPAVPGAPAIVLNNTGSGHRVGNHRLNVQIARRLAAQGWHVLRVDRAGLGYSRPTPDGKDNEVYAAGGVDDLQQAMDWLQQAMGLAEPGRFVLAGLCSGAYFAYRTAVADPRVCGLVMINPLTFNWHDGDALEVRAGKHFKSTGFYLRNLFSGATWRRLWGGEIDWRGITTMMIHRGLIRLRHRLLSGGGRMAEGLAAEHSVPRNFLQLAHREVDLMFIFGADDAAIDVTTAELGPNAQILKDYARLRIEVIHHVDHTLTPRWSQHYLLDLLGSHLRRL